MGDDTGKQPSASATQSVAGRWKEKFRRGRHYVWKFIAEIGKANWIITLIALLIAFLSYRILSRDEDLRVTIRGEAKIQDYVRLNFHFINLGKQSASIENIGLFEVDTAYIGDNVENNLSSCDNINENTLAVLWTMGGIMGHGSRVGGDKLQTAYFGASKRMVDGIAKDLNTPIFVDATKEKLVSVDFPISGFDATRFNTMIICPSFSMLDKNGKTRLAICKGYVINVTGPRHSQYEVYPLWRLLPRGTETQCTE